jgi:hypothetical protein
MSWDLLVMRLPEGTRSLTALSSRFEPLVLGTSSQIVSKLTVLGVEWISVEYRTLGVVRNDLFVLEIELPVGPVDHLVLTLHGEDAVDAARGVLDVLDASAVDLDTDLVVDLGAPQSRRQAKQSLDFACA